MFPTWPPIRSPCLALTASTKSSVNPRFLALRAPTASRNHSTTLPPRERPLRCRPVPALLISNRAASPCCAFALYSSSEKIGITRLPISDELREPRRSRLFPRLRRALAHPLGPDFRHVDKPLDRRIKVDFGQALG